MRVGIGYDVHKLVANRPLILGGERIPSAVGLAGHSDADVLLHAVADALLGAAALGDIGVLYPDTDEQWCGADSMDLLRTVGERVAEAGLAVSNIDATVALQSPKLRPFIDAMRHNIARALGIGFEMVSVKATTTEGLGFVGTGEGAAAYAICLLLPTG